MEVRHLALALVFLSGCTTAVKAPEVAVQPEPIPENKINVESQPVVEQAPPKKIKKIHQAHQKQNYAGQRGFLTRPPMFADSNQEKSFQRCLPIEIISLNQNGKTVSVQAKQGEQTFDLIGLNRKNFAFTKKNKLPLLDQYFTKELSVSSAGRKVASEQERVCAGQTWKEMPKDQFQFVTGDPEYRQLVKFPAGEYDVWTYGSVKQSNLRHYYFLSDRLMSWTQ